jgi:hypothetical protein
LVLSRCTYAEGRLLVIGRVSARLQHIHVVVDAHRLKLSARAVIKAAQPAFVPGAGEPT